MKHDVKTEDNELKVNKMSNIYIVTIILMLLSITLLDNVDTEIEFVDSPEYIDHIIVELDDNEPLTEILEPKKEIEYPEHWTCFDIAMNYSEQHPEWGLVLMSQNPKFQGHKFGDNHLVNYKVLPNKWLLIHDETQKNNKEHIVGGWEYDSCSFVYYHFYLDGEIPTRTWLGDGALKPNAEYFYNTLNV